MRKRITIKAENPTIREAFSMFMNDCRAKNLSPSTLLDYQTKITMFLETCGDAHTDDINTDTVNEFIMYLKSRGIKPTSVQSYLRSVKAFIRYLQEYGFTQDFRVRIPKAEEEIKELYSDDDLRKLVKKPDMKTADFAEIRDWAVVCVLIGSGCRIGSLLEMCIADVDLEQRILLFRKTKARKALVVPMPETLRIVLREYLKIRKGGPDDFLFINVYGDQCSRSGLQTTIRRYSIRRDVQPRGLHCFRHKFATEFLKSGGGILQLQRLMGHSDIRQTEHYTHLITQDLQESVMNYNCLDKINSQRTRIKNR